MPPQHTSNAPSRLTCRPHGRRWGRSAVVWCTLLSMLVGAVGGCSEKKKNWFKRKSTSQYIDMALESANPDERRQGVNGLAESADAASDWAVKVFDTIARTDSNTAVRCAAVRALHRSAGAQHVPTLLKLLLSESQRVADVRAAPGPLRWEAAKLLCVLVGGHSYNEANRDEIMRVLRERSEADRDRNVRLALIDAMGFFQDPAVLQSLIELLREDDFAITRAAEQSLIALTGVTHRHDPDAWQAWLASTSNPFELAGHSPADARVESKSNWSWDW